ncbi:LacI family DNA-binding transcriptional regulator [Stenotrophomonas sp. MH1]|uniref:LacI family DNA-binding transcriptional regulator n=1 Tax=Stenotrophomonas capsici TaxID=3110230 RepID=A0ABU5V1V1_9GAMM|nr:LacI family DNA-binding transcriptional regulator [Stenotrophomonas sp. MH1]MEA5667331.1 LacI family DNA-binding transcriptional regulator [Stenotrophomonas sp. MH1]
MTGKKRTAVEAKQAPGSGRPGRVRIEDVAASAGVSIKTVSRVLNNEPNVSARTRAQVEAAVEQLRYRPLPSARVLAGRRSYLVAMLFDNPSSNYLMEIELGVLDACQAQHYNLMLAPLVYNADDIVAKVESLIMQSQLDGIVLTPPLTDDDALLARLVDLGVPYSSISAREQNRHVGVVVDEFGAVCALMAHLAGLGHTRIAHISGPAAHGASTWRLAGYREGLRRAGLRYDAKLVVNGEFSYESGYAGANQLLDSAQPPTAIFAGNDDMAAGVICAISERGLSVPGDISVSGFDDTPIARQIYPSLTTIRQPTREMGRVAASELLKEIREMGSGGVVDLAYTLQVRRSTGPASG